jgi:hypothetical protein
VIQILLNHEHLFEYFSGLFLSFFGKPDRLRFPDRIGDQTFFMEPIHRIPIKAFPNNAAMIKVEIEQSQNRVINAFLIEFQRWLLFLFHFRTHARFMDEVALMKFASGGFQDAIVGTPLTVRIGYFVRCSSS